MTRHVVTHTTDNHSSSRVFDNLKDAEAYAGAIMLHLYRSNIALINLTISSPCVCCNVDRGIYADNLCESCWSHQRQKEDEMAEWVKRW